MNKSVTVSLKDLLPLIKESFLNNQKVEIMVTGNSMSPFLRDKKTIVILQKYSQVLKKHNIYFFSVSGTYVLHRYIKTKNNIHFFRGDALKKYEIVLEHNILAEVVSITGKKIVNPYGLKSNFKLFIFLFIKELKFLAKRILRR